MATPETKVAVVGLAGRFPGARSITELWTDVIRNGTEAIDRFDLDDGGEESEQVGFGTIENPAHFDNEFFDISPAEARRITPQHRLFLEYVWKALESAGTDITEYPGYASIYGSCSMNTVAYLRRLIDESEREGVAGSFDLLLGNSKDSMATRAGYKLDVNGECVTVQTHCSSSLTAVHMACQSLLSGQSDLAIAGGVSVRGSVEELQQEDLANQAATQEGFVSSPDGRCRALLEGANGVINGDGVGVVVLKPLLDAIDDRNTIFSVISGSAINNDGRQKVGFTAPSVDGVEGVIRDALAFADIDPDEVGYLECHGTGTDLGDAIELRALQRVFDNETRSGRPLELGSVKSNIGHLGAGAGVLGLIKASLAIYNEGLPPLCHADEYDPHAQIEQTETFAVSDEFSPWEAPEGYPRRAGVNSLGIGGTNVHVLLEEAPESATRDEASAPERPSTLMAWSAKTPNANDDMRRRLAAYLKLRPDPPPVEDVTYTLQKGRAEFSARGFVVASDADDAVEALEAAPDVERGWFDESEEERGLAFMFPGAGAHRPGMGRELLEADSIFQEAVDECQEILDERTEFDLRSYFSDENAEGSDLGYAEYQVAVVSFEYALAQRYLESGCVPKASIGSSLGEYAAACVAGAMSLTDTIHLVHRRGELLDRVTGGGMLLVDAGLGEVRDWDFTPDGIEPGIIVSDEDTVLSGPQDAIEDLEEQLEQRNIAARRLPVDIAFHTSAVEPIREDFMEAVSRVDFREPEIPFVSNLTGERVEFGTFDSPEYWYKQMRETVQFRDGMEVLYGDGVRYFLEVGSGRGLSKFCSWIFSDRDDVVAKSSTTHPESGDHDWSAVLDALGTAWLDGHSLDWDAIGPEGRIVQVPTYPFQRKYFLLGEELPEREPAEQAAEFGNQGGTERERPEERTMPRNPLEQQVAEMWSDVLGVQDVGIRENFFELGGDSLQATRVVGRIQAELYGDIAVEDVMERRTIEEVASFIADQLEGEDESGREPTDEEDQEEYYCVFELEFAGSKSTVYMSREEYEQEGIPDDAENVEFFDS